MVAISGSEQAAGHVEFLLTQLDDIRGRWELPFEAAAPEQEIAELLDRWSGYAMRRLAPLLNPPESKRCQDCLALAYRYDANGEIHFHFDYCRSYLSGLQFALLHDPESVASVGPALPDEPDNAGLSAALAEMHELLRSVATGGPMIQKVNPRYRELYRLVDVELRKRGGYREPDHFCRPLEVV